MSEKRKRNYPGNWAPNEMETVSDSSPLGLWTDTAAADDDDDDFTFGYATDGLNLATTRTALFRPWLVIGNLVSIITKSETLQCFWPREIFFNRDGIKKSVDKGRTLNFEVCFLSVHLFILLSLYFELIYFRFEWVKRVK